MANTRETKRYIRLSACEEARVAAFTGGVGRRHAVVLREAALIGLAQLEREGKGADYLFPRNGRKQSKANAAADRGSSDLN